MCAPVLLYVILSHLCMCASVWGVYFINIYWMSSISTIYFGIIEMLHVIL